VLSAYVIEQFNRHLKDNVLDEYWIRPRVWFKKAVTVLAGLICLNANAVEALVEEEASLRAVSKHWD
jgi:hypothetical protein